VLVPFVAFVALGAVELGHRVWLRTQGKAYDGPALYTDLVRNLDTMAAFTPTGAAANTSKQDKKLLHPFYGAEQTHDSGGVLAYFRNDPPADDYTIAIIGGSVAAAWARDHDDVFKQLLEADPRLAGRNVKILEFAHAAYKQPQQLNRVAFLFSLGYLPDAVINLDGFNEVANGLQNGMTGTHPLFPTAPVWASLLWGRGAIDPEQIQTVAALSGLRNRAEALLGQARRLRFFKSSILGTLTKARVSKVYAQRAALQQSLAAADDPAARRKELRSDRELIGPDYDKDPQAIAELSVTNWFESSLSLQALCEARGVYYMHCLQPTMHDYGSKPLTEKERGLTGAKFWEQGVQLGYDHLRERGQELTRRGVDFVDTSYAFKDEEGELYYDACHFVARGCQLLSRQIAPIFLERAFE